jgi:hypothetical protein
LAHTGKPEEALAILETDGGLEIPDLREGDNAVPEEYIFIRQALAEKEGRTLQPEDVEVPVKIDFRMFYHRKL